MKNLFLSIFILLAMSINVVPASAEVTEKLLSVNILKPDFVGTSSPASYGIQSTSWGTDRIGADRLKAITSAIEGGSAIVAVIDTGVDYNHPLLKERIIDGYDFVDNDEDPMDLHFHGTHVAGIIADTTPSGVKIMPLRAMDNHGNGFDMNIAKGIRYAVDNGADIINLSFSGLNYSATLANAFDYALTRNVPIILSAGNEGKDTLNSYPASEERVIVVSATDRNDKIASFSNTGKSIDVSAPGVDIISSIPNGQYGSLSGTSMAAPFVSGIVAMLKMEDPTRSIAEIELLLETYTDDRGTTGWDPIFGEGIVNVKNYINRTLPIDDKIATQRAIPLNKVFTVTMNRKIAANDKVTIRLVRGDKEIPITISPYVNQNQIIVTPTEQLLSDTKYLLEVNVENGKSMKKFFITI